MILRGWCTRCQIPHTWGFKSRPEDKGVQFEVKATCPRCQGPVQMAGKEEA